jgi:hypothetical protein
MPPPVTVIVAPPDTDDLCDDANDADAAEGNGTELAMLGAGGCVALPPLPDVSLAAAAHRGASSSGDSSGSGGGGGVAAAAAARKAVRIVSSALVAPIRVR